VVLNRKDLAPNASKRPNEKKNLWADYKIEVKLLQGEKFKVAQPAVFINKISEGGGDKQNHS